MALTKHDNALNTKELSLQLMQPTRIYVDK